MDWFNRADIQALAEREFGSAQVQIISLYADLKRLPNDMPMPAEPISTAEGPPVEMHQWYARIGRRCIIVEVEAVASASSSAAIYTHYLPTQNSAGDWTVLFDLLDLPKSIFASRPLFIQSRAEGSEFVVYRPNAAGWNSAIYEANSRADAEGLLAFLHQDQWNLPCFIGGPVPPGDWVIMQGEEKILGAGSGLESALASACQLSSNNRSKSLHVKDKSGQSQDIYVVSGGRVRTDNEEAN